MCGRFSQGEPSHRISEYFGAYPDDDLPDGLYNVPPTETIRMVVARGGERRLASARWGFKPSWAGENGGRRGAWINARAETAPSSSAFGPALRSHRCVIPADAFYEWDRSTTPRQPYAIGPATEGAMLALAGIWSPSRDGKPTVAILTTAPNSLVERVHDRMPVIIEPALVGDWLDPSASLAGVLPLLAPAPAEALRMWPVSTAVNRVESEGRQLLDAVEVPVTLGLA